MIETVIREATQDDFPRLVDLGEVMHAESRFARLDYSRGKVERLLHEVLYLPDTYCAFVAVHGEQVIGGLIGICVERYFSTERVAQDLAIFIEPGKRGGLAGTRLIRRFRRWAQERGATDLEIAINTGVQPMRSGRLLQACGLEPIATLYTQELR